MWRNRFVTAQRGQYAEIGIFGKCAYPIDIDRDRRVGRVSREQTMKRCSLSDRAIFLL